MKINYPAVLVAAILHWILGAVWYGIFTNKFVELMAWTPEQLRALENQSHGKEYVMAFLSSLVLVYVLAHFVQYTKATNLVGGLQTAFWLWLGFVATTQAATVIFEGRKPGLYLLNIGYQLVACLAAGALLAIWKPRAATAPASQPA
ncbi:MAG: DUF1761 domain-containing protein [Pyrinomonadaceae bacterium]